MVSNSTRIIQVITSLHGGFQWLGPSQLGELTQSQWMEKAVLQWWYLARAHTRDARTFPLSSRNQNAVIHSVTHSTQLFTLIMSLHSKKNPKNRSQNLPVNQGNREFSTQSNLLACVLKIELDALVLDLQIKGVLIQHMNHARYIWANLIWIKLLWNG